MGYVLCIQHPYFYTHRVATFLSLVWYLHGVLAHEEDVAGLVALLVAEEDVRVEVDGGAGGVLRHAVAVVDVVGDVLRRLLVEQLPVVGKVVCKN